MNNDGPDGTVGAKADAEEIANSRLVPQLEMMARALLAAPVRNTLFMLSGSIFIVIAATAYGQIRLNSWNQPFYDALSHRSFPQFLDQLGIFHSRQYEFDRLNLTYTVMSKRKLLQLVQQGIVEGWDDPRMPTISGMRRRGYPSQGLRNFARSLGVSKTNGISVACGAPLTLARSDSAFAGVRL